MAATAVSDAELDQELGAALRERGYRVTAPRLLVHRHLRRRAGHVTADELFDELAPALPSLSPATLYATLDLLRELGVVRKVSTPGGPAVYDPRPDAHHHLICSRCGAIEDLDLELDLAPAARAARPAGFRVEHGELQLQGLCARCAAAA
jgi:Fe2+ or Zn2+ uptake regulation protein